MTTTHVPNPNGQSSARPPEPGDQAAGDIARFRELEHEPIEFLEEED